MILFFSEAIVMGVALESAVTDFECMYQMLHPNGYLHRSIYR